MRGWLQAMSGKVLLPQSGGQRESLGQLPTQERATGVNATETPPPLRQTPCGGG